MLLLSFLCAIISFYFLLFASASQNSYYGLKNQKRSLNALVELLKQKSLPQHKVLIDKEERTIVVPDLSQTNVLNKPKKKVKKHPKRTVQKIIKKMKRNKKFYQNQVTSSSTQPTHYDEMPMETEPTTQETQKKKAKKFYVKYSSYTPFRFKSSKTNKHAYERRRNRRNVKNNEPERDLYILQDLDEVQFLMNENKDSDTVKVHFKKPW